MAGSRAPSISMAASGRAPSDTKKTRANNYRLSTYVFPIDVNEPEKGREGRLQGANKLICTQKYVQLTGRCVI
jgi:hypothetical protein